ncbi:MAG TPA: citryl-CoA lyase, partial [Solirubrobacteraceae bacterium]
MQIGAPGVGVSQIAQAYPDRVEVRGRDLAGDLMGRLTFTEFFHLLLTGREPTEDQRFFLDVLLVAIAEHGMMPSNVAARMTLAADPGSLQGAVAAGILGAGTVVLGASEECARLLDDTLRGGRDPGDVAREIRAARGKVPGFGHPVHKPLDPRAERLLQLADERGVSGPHVELARRLRDAVAEAWGRPLTMNVAMPIAAVMLDLGYPVATVKAVPILARTASLLGHL